MTRLRLSSFILMILLISGIALTTGCGDKMPPYENIASALDTYRTNYSEYRKSADPDMASFNNESSVRRDGTPCRSYYICSPDNKYRAVTLEYERNDTMMVDEYYYLSDNAFYVVNSYYDAETMTPYVTDYYVWQGRMYLMDEGSSSLVKTDSETSSGFYLSFDELVEQYGPVA